MCLRRTATTVYNLRHIDGVIPCGQRVRQPALQRRAGLLDKLRTDGRSVLPRELQATTSPHPFGLVTSL